MPFKKVNPSGDAWDFQENPTLEGKYVAMKDEVGPNKSKMYYFEVEGEGIGSVPETISMWGTTVIDNQMMLVPQGSKVKISYLGMATNEKTKREYKNFTVEIWED